MMIRRWMVLVAMVGCTISGAVAQDKGTWRAASKTAQAITGDVGFGNDRIGIDLSSFVVAQIRELQAAELSAAFDAPANTAGTGNLYRLSIPGTKVFLHKNKLCAGDETQWVATYVSGKTLQLVFFSGSQMPVFTGEAMANATNLCGTFSYVR